MYQNSIQKRQIIFCLSLILISPMASTARPTLPYDAQKIKEQQKKHLQSMKDYRTMKEPAEFADLPVYNGRTQFINGCLESNKNGVSTCEMQFMSQEDSQTIMDFYTNALASNGWKICYAGPRSICARHNKGHMCNINVNQSRTPKTKSQFVIDYRQIEPH